MDIERDYPEMWATIKEIGTWGLDEIKTQVHALNTSYVRQLFALKDEAAIGEAIDEALAQIKYGNSFEAWISWKMERVRPVFMEHEMERIRRKPPAGKNQPRNMAGVPRLRHSREESAAMLSMSLRTLDYHIAGQRLRVKHNGSQVVILHSELVRFAKEDHPGPVAPPRPNAS